jgi:hypothetical protein
MNRRGFLSLFGSAAAAAVIDPAELLWKPGTKAFSFPPNRVTIPPSRLTISGFTIGDIITIGNNPCHFVVTDVAESSVLFKPLPRQKQPIAFLRYVDTYPRIEL